jgi:glycosyltransferase involved in cell wall biosynthesis
MISVLTLTYQRHHILEEAIESFLKQDHPVGTEMVVLNDSPEVKYYYVHPKVRIVNVPERFSSVSKKLEYGYKICGNDYIYRLDDDDLLAPNALVIVANAINNNPGYEIYRSENHLYFHENRYQGLSGSINNGNVYSKSYLDRIEFPHLSGDEDVHITFGNNAKIHTIDKPTMIYRWGMGTYHISGMGVQPSELILLRTDKSIPNKEEGVILLTPHFNEDYYEKIKPLN